MYDPFSYSYPYMNTPYGQGSQNGGFGGMGGAFNPGALSSWGSFGGNAGGSFPGGGQSQAGQGWGMGMPWGGGMGGFFGAAPMGMQTGGPQQVTGNSPYPMQTGGPQTYNPGNPTLTNPMQRPSALGPMGGTPATGGTTSISSPFDMFNQQTLQNQQRTYQTPTMSTGFQATAPSSYFDFSGVNMPKPIY